jgi:hypothetical protein
VRVGSVVFTSDAANPSLAVGLSGAGVPLPSPRVTLSASSLGFGNALLGAGGFQSVTVTNSGSADLAFGPVEVTGDFTLANGCAGSVAPGQSCQIGVRFLPALPGCSAAQPLSPRMRGRIPRPFKGRMPA